MTPCLYSLWFEAHPGALVPDWPVVNEWAARRKPADFRQFYEPLLAPLGRVSEPTVLVGAPAAAFSREGNGSRALAVLAWRREHPDQWAAYMATHRLALYGRL